MATRPIFLPKKRGNLGVTRKPIDFKWFPGMSVSQKQKSIRSLHEASRSFDLNSLLEISSKSENELGKKLSAFNLFITTKTSGLRFSVECAFQGSKVFEFGGPFTDLLDLTSREAKKDPRLRESGSLKQFKFCRDTFPLKPRTYFYDWIYINALQQNIGLAEHLTEFDAFTDIEFNPEKSINCQAFSAALYVSMYENQLLGEALKSSQSFLEIMKNEYLRIDSQRVLQGTLI